MTSRKHIRIVGEGGGSAVRPTLLSSPPVAAAPRGCVPLPNGWVRGDDEGDDGLHSPHRMPACLPNCQAATNPVTQTFLCNGNPSRGKGVGRLV